MRRIISLITALLLILTLVPSSAFAESNYTITKAGVTVYEATGQRALACDKMNQMAEEPWTVTTPITYKYKSGSEYTLVEGLHRGVPYNQYSRLSPETDKIQENIDLAQTPDIHTEIDEETGEEYEVVEYNNPVRGTDCSSALTYALRYATGNEGRYNSFLMTDTLQDTYRTHQFLFDGMRYGSGYQTTVSGTNRYYRDNLSKVGYYGKYTGYLTANETVSMIEALTAEDNYDYGTVYDNVYAKMKPGDILVKVTNSFGHVMIVDKVKLVYNSDGLIDPKKSKVYITDQSSPDRSVFADGALSSWRSPNTHSSANGNTNYIFKFETIALSGYFLPVTVWPENTTYRVSYDLNGGTGYVSGQTKSTYMPLVLSSKVPTMTGYTFDGWQSTSNPAELIYPAGGVYFEEANDVLKATWKLNQGKVLYDANGGSDGPKWQMQYYNKPLTLTSKVPERKNYEFTGWSGRRDAASAEYLPKGSFTDDSRLLSSSGATYTLYAVWQKSVKDSTVKFSKSSAYYTGEEFRPSVSVLWDGETLTEGVDYTLTLPEESVNNGTYVVTVKGMGEYSGEVKASYTIKPHTQKISGTSSYTKTYGNSSFTLDSKGKTDLSYKSSNSDVVSVDENGKVRITGAGKATITVTAEGTDYYAKATKTISVTVKPKSTSIQSVVSPAAGTITVKWAKVSSQASGYQIKYSRNSGFTQSSTVTVSGRTTASKNITGLARRAKYYVKIRTYKTSGGVKYYSSWSSAKTVTVK